jgi:hypothetical protein
MILRMFSGRPLGTFLHPDFASDRKSRWLSKKAMTPGHYVLQRIVSQAPHSSTVSTARPVGDSENARAIHARASPRVFVNRAASDCSQHSLLRFHVVRSEVHIVPQADLGDPCHRFCQR